MCDVGAHVGWESGLSTILIVVALGEVILIWNILHEFRNMLGVRLGLKRYFVMERFLVRGEGR